MDSEEDSKYLDLDSLKVADLRRVLSKYNVELGTQAQNKSFLRGLYKKHNIAEKIKQRQEEDLKRKMTPRKRTIEMVEPPTKRVKHGKTPTEKKATKQTKKKPEIADFIE